MKKATQSNASRLITTLMSRIMGSGPWQGSEFPGHCQLLAHKCGSYQSIRRAAHAEGVEQG
eukprot:scaffold20672_cov25-Tisochrysis_lutea.AAC.3